MRIFPGIGRNLRNPHHQVTPADNPDHEVPQRRDQNQFKGQNLMEKEKPERCLSFSSSSQIFSESDMSSDPSDSDSEVSIAQGLDRESRQLLRSRIQPRIPQDRSKYPGFPPIELFRKGGMPESMLNELICSFWRRYRNRKNYRRWKRKKQKSEPKEPTASNQNTFSSSPSAMLNNVPAAGAKDPNPAPRSRGKRRVQHSPLTLDLTEGQEACNPARPKQPPKGKRAGRNLSHQVAIYGGQTCKAPISELDFESLIGGLQEIWINSECSSDEPRIEGFVFVGDHGIIRCTDLKSRHYIQQSVQKLTIDGKKFRAWPKDADDHLTDCSVFLHKTLDSFKASKLIRRCLVGARLKDRLAVKHVLAKPNGRVVHLRIPKDSAKHIQSNEGKLWAGLTVLYFRFRGLPAREDSPVSPSPMETVSNGPKSQSPNRNLKNSFTNIGGALHKESFAAQTAHGVRFPPSGELDSAKPRSPIKCAPSMPHSG